MQSTKKPYLIIPKLIEQPTWGGDYILNFKKWSHSFLKGKIIGQSYELFSGSKLTTTIVDTENEKYIPEFGFADTSVTLKDNFNLEEGKDFFTLSDFVASAPQRVVGKKVFDKFQKMPLLIKFTQALGNSFQLHVPPIMTHPKWQPKPESWLYFENGLITCGIKKNCDLKAYKKVCHEINNFMISLSEKIVNKKIDLEEARELAKDKISHLDPWQFVNIHEPQVNELIDLSKGGLQHSWEEDRARFPLGNVLYEVQLDVMDPVSTIRSFDQGKIKDDGTIRKLDIEDFFQFLDTNPEHNDIQNVRRQRVGKKLLSTPYYSLDVLDVNESATNKTNDSFSHFFVREGDVSVFTDEGAVHLTQGHSCFIPADAKTYEVKAIKKSVLLKTFIEV